MNPIEETLATLRRGHVVLFICGVALAGLAVPRTNVHEPAIVEARAIQALLASGGIDAICAQNAERLFDEYWAGIWDDAQQESGMALTPAGDFKVSFTAHCPYPSANRRLTDIRTFLEEGLWVDLPTPADSSLAGLLARNAGQGSLETARIAWEGAAADTLTDRVVLAALTDAQLVSINAGEDSLDAVLTFASRLPSDSVSFDTSTVDTLAADSVAVDSASLAPALARDTTTRTFGVAVSSRLGGSVFQELLPPEDFLASDDRWRLLIGEDTGDGLPPEIFPQLQRYWFEVERLSPADAMRRLEERSALFESSVQLLGVTIGFGTLGLGGAALLLVLLFYMTMTMGHLRQLASKDVEEVGRWPWFPLYAGSTARISTWVSVVLVPAGALGMLSYRLYLGSNPLATVVLVSALLCLILGVRVLWDLRGLRAALTPAPPPPSPRGRKVPG